MCVPAAISVVGGEEERRRGKNFGIKVLKPFLSPIETVFMNSLFINHILPSNSFLQMPIHHPYHFNKLEFIDVGN